MARLTLQEASLLERSLKIAADIFQSMAGSSALHPEQARDFTLDGKHALELARRVARTPFIEISD